MKEVFEELKKKLESMSREELDDEYESITHEKFWNRWVDKFHNLPKEHRFNIISKAIEKYNSDEYIDKEYKLGYEPREELFTLFHKYSEVYGVELPEEYYTDFVADARIIDDTWVIQLLIGQGSVIHVTHRDNFNK